MYRDGRYLQQVEPRIDSELQELARFFSSQLWKDIRGVLETGIELAHSDMEKPCSENETNFMRGAITQIREFLELEWSLVELKKNQLAEEHMNTATGGE